MALPGSSTTSALIVACVASFSGFVHIKWMSEVAAPVESQVRQPEEAFPHDSASVGEEGVFIMDVDLLPTEIDHARALNVSPEPFLLDGKCDSVNLSGNYLEVLYTDTDGIQSADSNAALGRKKAFGDYFELTDLFGLGIMFDIVAAFVSACLWRRFRPKASCAEAAQNESASTLFSTKPLFVQARAPAPHAASDASDFYDHELKARINAIVHAHAKQRRTSVTADSKDSKMPADIQEQIFQAQLQAQINAIVREHVETRRACENWDEAQKAREMLYFQELANEAIHAAEERRKKRLSGATADLASPSPAKSLSDDEVVHHANLALVAAKERNTPSKRLSDAELAQHAHLALSAAKERNTPAKSPPPGLVDWETYEEEEVAPRMLNFQDGANTTDAATEEVPCTEVDAAHPLLRYLPAEPAPAIEISETAAKAKDSPPPFDVSQIPSPTRSRAKKLAVSLFESGSANADMQAEEQAASPQPSPQKDFVSRLQSGAIHRMLAHSATPTKQTGAQTREQRCSAPQGMQYQ